MSAGSRNAERMWLIGGIAGQQPGQSADHLARNLES